MSTDDSPLSHSVPADDPHPSVPPAGGPPPPHLVPTTDDHSPPSMSKRPGAPKFENFFGKLMRGRFKRRISGYGPGDVVQRVSKETVGPSAYVFYPFPSSSANVHTTRVTNILIFLCSIVRDFDVIE
jgi:hypothetical protein